MKIDDSLDVFAVHGVGGILGTLLIPFLANIGPMAPGLGETTLTAQLNAQVLGVLSVSAWSIIASVVILFALKATIGLRVSQEDEEIGLDNAIHGETAYGG